MHDGEMTYPMGEPTFERPTLLSSCALAATAAEAQFRISYPNSRPRVTQVIALDGAAAALVAEAAAVGWQGATFYSLVAPLADMSPDNDPLLGSGNKQLRFSALLPNSDVVVMVSTNGTAAGQAERIGQMARAHGVTTVALIVAAQQLRNDVEPLAAALRPASAVLVISEGGSDYLIDMLSALRA